MGLQDLDAVGIRGRRRHRDVPPEWKKAGSARPISPEPLKPSPPENPRPHTLLSTCEHPSGTSLQSIHVIYCNTCRSTPHANMPALTINVIIVAQFFVQVGTWPNLDSKVDPIWRNGSRGGAHGMTMLASFTDTAPAMDANFRFPSLVAGFLGMGNFLGEFIDREALRVPGFRVRPIQLSRFESTLREAKVWAHKAHLRNS